MGILKAGDLRERITLLTPGPTVPDSSGGHLAGPATEAAVWAQVTPLGTRELLALGQTLNTAAYRITIRRRVGVSAKQRVRWQGRELNVQGVTADPDREYLVLTCFASGREAPALPPVTAPRPAPVGIAYNPDTAQFVGPGQGSAYEIAVTHAQ